MLLPTTGDRGPLVELSLPTILDQSVSDLEVFVVGDGVSPAARTTIERFAAADPRVRFFDQPKDARRGERRRHHILGEARGRIVCYLTDRDLMLPDHVAVMDELLNDADFAHSLCFAVTEEGGISFHHVADFSDPRDRAAHSPWGHVPLSFAAHTLDMYRRLPFGWRATPPGASTDTYMWDQFLDHPDCRVAVSQRPTILYFRRGEHPGWPVDRRRAELAGWVERLRDPAWLARFREEVRDQAIADRARLAREAAPAAIKRWLTQRFPDRVAWLREHRSVDALADWLRTELARVSPWAALARARHGLGTMPSNATRPQVMNFESARLGPELRIELGWVSQAPGPGPRASVFAFGDELLRLDCFAGDAGHMHINMKQSDTVPGMRVPRIKFPPADAFAQIERGVFELTENLAYAIRTHRDPRVRALVVEPARLSQAAAWMRERMQHMTAQYGAADQKEPRE